MGRGGDDAPLRLERPMPLPVASTEVSGPTDVCCFKAVAVGVENECCVVAWAVLRSRTWKTVVDATLRQGRRVKCGNSRRGWGGECDMTSR